MSHALNLKNRYVGSTPQFFHRSLQATISYFRFAKKRPHISSKRLFSREQTFTQTFNQTFTYNDLQQRPAQTRFGGKENPPLKTQIMRREMSFCRTGEAVSAGQGLPIRKCKICRSHSLRLKRSFLVIGYHPGSTHLLPVRAIVWL